MNKGLLTSVISFLVALGIFVQSNSVSLYLFFVGLTVLFSLISYALIVRFKIKGLIFKIISILIIGILTLMLYLFISLVYSGGSLITHCMDHSYKNIITGKIISPDCYDGYPAWYYKQID